MVWDPWRSHGTWWTAAVEPTHSDAWIEANSDSLESVLESLEVADPAPNLARAAAARNAA
jgi:hypothetical protein